MVAVHSERLESEGKAEMPGVGCIIRSISSFWRLGDVSQERKGERIVGNEMSSAGWQR